MSHRYVSALQSSSTVKYEDFTEECKVNYATKAWRCHWPLVTQVANWNATLSLLSVSGCGKRLWGPLPWRRHAVLSYEVWRTLCYHFNSALLAPRARDDSDALSCSACEVCCEDTLCTSGCAQPFSAGGVCVRAATCAFQLIDNNDCLAWGPPLLLDCSYLIIDRRVLFRTFAVLPISPLINWGVCHFISAAMVYLYAFQSDSLAWFLIWVLLKSTIKSAIKLFYLMQDSLVPLFDQEYLGRYFLSSFAWSGIPC